MSYSEKLKDPRWQRKRLEILQRDEWCCRICFDTAATLHVHHRCYLAGHDPWEYDDQYLQTLCEHCHKRETEMLPAVRSELLDTLAVAGAGHSELLLLAGAFAPGVDKQLWDLEWSIVCWHIKLLLTDRSKGNPAWSGVYRAYFEAIRSECGLVDELKAAQPQ